MKVVCLGDSITEGCFECYTDENGKICTIKNKELSYSSLLNNRYNKENKDVTIINSGISGNTSIQGLKRIDKDVLSYNPDICVVSFGINDCLRMTLLKYIITMNKIFNILKKNKIQIIFLTENYMCTYISDELTDSTLRKSAQELVQAQNSGLYNLFRLSMLSICKLRNIKVCDIYKEWDKLYRSGVDVTKLLINRLNHPNYEYQELIANKLYETLNIK